MRATPSVLFCVFLVVPLVLVGCDEKKPKPMKYDATCEVRKDCWPVVNINVEDPCDCPCPDTAIHKDEVARYSRDYGVKHKPIRCEEMECPTCPQITLLCNDDNMCELRPAGDDGGLRDGGDGGGTDGGDTDPVMSLPDAGDGG